VAKAENEVDLSKMLVPLSQKHTYDTSLRFPFTNYVSFGNFGPGIPHLGSKNSGKLTNAELHFGIVDRNAAKYSRIVSIGEDFWGVVEAKYFSSANCSGQEHSGIPISSHLNAGNAYDSKTNTIWSTEDKPETMSYVGLQWEEAAVVRSVYLELSKSTSDDARIRIQSSEDGKLWTTKRKLR
jgi:hypothetical protein